MNIRREIRRAWKPRPRRSHKGDYGRVLVVAGSEGMTGAAHLSACASLRAGAGLVTLAVPRKIYPIAARREAEIMVRPFASTPQGSFSSGALRPIIQFMKTQDVIALGPGLSVHPQTQRFVRKLLRALTGPVILDADGLNALKGHTPLLKHLRGRAILTPHPGEFKRLFGAVSASEDQRKNRAREAAKRWGVYVILKGFHTVVAHPDGRVFVNQTGNPGMATGGTGDVLTGILAALVGQKFSLWDASRFGVYLHGLAGDLAAKKRGEISLTAGDLLESLPEAIRKTAR